jgi:hypothetical protein
MDIINLGKLAHVDPRDQWRSEPRGLYALAGPQ